MLAFKGLASFMVLALCLEFTHFEAQSAAIAEVAKDAGKALVAGIAEDKADETSVPKTGATRRKILHVAADVALDHGLKAATLHPAGRVVAPIARHLAAPLLEKAHKKIDNLFNKSEEAKDKTEQAPKDEAAKDEPAKEVEKSEDKETGSEKSGHKDKIKGLFKGDDKANSKEEPKPEELKVEEPKPEEHPTEAPKTEEKKSDEPKVDEKESDPKKEEPEKKQ